MDCLLFDADNDGDLDLLITYGDVTTSGKFDLLSTKALYE